MVRVVTDLGDLRESARRLRFEQTAGISDTDVQDAIKTLDTRTNIGTIAVKASAATVTLSTSDIEVGIDTRSTAVTVDLPSAAAWAAANPNGLELWITDYYGNASANNITPSLFAGDSFQYGGVVPKITMNFGRLALRPIPGLPGWYVRGVNV